MSFEIVTYQVDGNESTLLDQNAHYYGNMACCYVREYLTWGRRDLNTEQTLAFGNMLLDFYERFSTTTDILGVDNSEVVVDGAGLGELEGVD